MRRLTAVCRCALMGAVLVAAPGAWALEFSVPAIGGDASRGLLGDGSGVVVGVVDSGVDLSHPAFSTLDSLGQPRLVAEANFVAAEPTNTGQDLFGHGTRTASVIASGDALHTGLAPDARIINARVLDATNSFADDAWVRNGVGFALDAGADVLNLSLNYDTTSSSGTTPLDLMLDWAAQQLGVMSVVSAGNVNSSGDRVRGPGGAYNGLTVGWTDADFDQVHPDSAEAFTQNNRMKPDLVAPGEAITMANFEWETGPDFIDRDGSSYAAPHATGLLAQQIEAGRDAGLSTNPLVLKATMMNSASKDVLDKDGDPWATAGSTQPLDPHSGAGQIDGAALAAQYLAGEHAAGAVEAIGWDLASVADDAFVDYAIDAPLLGGSQLTATLTWFRDVTRTDRGELGVIDAGDTFNAASLDNLDLELWADDLRVARSASFFDNVEHLTFTVDPLASYTLRVAGASVLGADAERPFAVAWSAVAVPEPATGVLLALAGVALASRRRL